MLTICVFLSISGTCTQLRLLLCWLFISISSSGGSGECICVNWSGWGFWQLQLGHRAATRRLDYPAALHEPTAFRLTGVRPQKDTKATLISLKATYILLVKTDKCRLSFSWPGPFVQTLSKYLNMADHLCIISQSSVLSLEHIQVKLCFHDS